MEWLSFREPVNAWTHGGWLLMALPACFLLHIRAGRQMTKQLSLAAFSLGLVCCMLGSFTYHAVRVSADSIELAAMLDQVAIYLLIAGTATPIVVVLLEGSWRIGSLVAMWTMAAAGISLRVTRVPLPSQVTTAFYILMGWTAVFVILQLARRAGGRAMRLLILGGLLYSTGAVLNETQWLNWWPGVFGAHELHHLCVMGGSLCHYLFMLRIVAPYQRTGRPGAEPTPIPELAPA